MTVKERLQKVVEAMSEEEAAEALHLLDPLSRILDNAPLDDEPETEEERAAVAEARAELAAGAPTIPLEQVKRELGLA